MAFKSRERSGTKYVGISKGHLVITVPEGTEGAVSRVNKEGNEVFEILHDTFEGHITDVKIKVSTNAYPDQLFIFVHDRDEGGRIIIQTAYDSQYAEKFYKVMKKLNLRAPVEFAPYHMPNDKKPGKFVTGWNLYQGGEKLVTDYEKGDLPEWKPIKVAVPGKKEKQDGFDKSEYMDVLLKTFDKWQKEKNLGEYKNEEEEAPSSRQSTSHDESDEEDDG